MPLHTLSFPDEVASVLLEYVPERQLNEKVTVRMCVVRKQTDPVTRENAVFLAISCSSLGTLFTGFSGLVYSGYITRDTSRSLPTSAQAIDFPSPETSPPQICKKCTIKNQGYS